MYSCSRMTGMNTKQTNSEFPGSWSINLGKRCWNRAKIKYPWIAGKKKQTEFVENTSLRRRQQKKKNQSKGDKISTQRNLFQPSGIRWCLTGNGENCVLPADMWAALGTSTRGTLQGPRAGTESLQPPLLWNFTSAERDTPRPHNGMCSLDGTSSWEGAEGTHSPVLGLAAEPSPEAEQGKGW